MTKQELITHLEVQKELLYKRHETAYQEWNVRKNKYGASDIYTYMAEERMEVMSTKIDDIILFIELLETLED